MLFMIARMPVVRMTSRAFLEQGLPQVACRMP